MKNSQITCTATNIQHCYTGIHIHIAHHSTCTCKRLQYQILGLQQASFNSTVYIPDGIFIAGDDMKRCTYPYTHVPYRILYILIIIYTEFLWYHFNDLIACRNKCFLLILYQLINFRLLNFNIRVLSYNIPSCLQTLNMMSRNTNIHLIYF